MFGLGAVLLVAAMLVALPSYQNAGETISGHARVIDGDTIEIGARRIRLHGIDAPEAGQQCSGFPAGQYARKTLHQIVGSAALVCQVRGEDRYGRAIATCEVNGEDIAQSMTRAGAAFAYARYSLDYVDEEMAARFDNRGLWPMHCGSPEAYRHAR